MTATVSQASYQFKNCPGIESLSGYSQFVQLFSVFVVVGGGVVAVVVVVVVVVVDVVVLCSARP